MGLEREDKMWAVKDMVKRWKIGVFSLQETKLQNIDRRMTADMWGRMSFDFIHKLAVGTSDGILVASDFFMFEVIDHWIGGFLPQS